MTAFYSEFDPSAAAWLRELIADGHISPGAVDDRDIREVSAADLAGHGRVHLFAGIGGWELALRLAGWPAERSVWTGSCPCQPFSTAGKQKANADERHLWPEMFRLIRECRPDTIFGEQVEGSIRHGWLDGVCRDLEGEGYAVGSAVLGAHSVGAPHIRQRLFWVADRIGLRFDGRHGVTGDGDANVPQGLRGVGRMANAELQRTRRGDGQERASEFGRNRPAIDRAAGFWDAFNLIPCRDGKSRRVEPGSFPLAHGVPGRVGLLRGYGNAIVPQLAAAFVTAFFVAGRIADRPYCPECLGTKRKETA